MAQRTWTDLDNSLRRIAKVSRQEAQTDRLAYEYIETVQPYPIGHIFYGVTLADPQRGVQYDGPSYIDLAFRALVKSPQWRQARVEFTEHLLDGVSVTDARYRIVCTYCF